MRMPHNTGSSFAHTPTRVSHHVLVIDDDLAIRQLVTEVLSDEGYVVVAVDSASAGLRAVATDPPALIFLDMRLPDDGPRFKRELRDRANGARIVAMSGSPEGAVWARSMGVQFLSKPFDVERIVATAREQV